MTIEQFFATFGPSALPAAAILFAVRMMLTHMSKELVLERKARASEMNKLLKVFVAMVKILQHTDEDEETGDLVTELENAIEEKS